MKIDSFDSDANRSMLLRFYEQASVSYIVRCP